MKYKIILASNSPRRRELLKGLDLDFEVRIRPDIEEAYPSGLAPGEVPLFIAKEKAKIYADEIQPDELIITADTVVVLENEVLEKPEDEADAIKMMKCLSGRKHQVITAVVITTEKKSVDFSVISTVDFSDLTDEEIQYYVSKYRPFDKAGSYGIQEWIGYIGVKSIEGSFYNVMGLPVQRLYRELKKFSEYKLFSTFATRYT